MSQGRKILQRVFVTAKVTAPAGWISCCFSELCALVGARIADFRVLVGTLIPSCTCGWGRSCDPFYRLVLANSFQEKISGS